MSFFTLMCEEKDSFIAQYNLLHNYTQITRNASRRTAVYYVRAVYNCYAMNRGSVYVAKSAGYVEARVRPSRDPEIKPA